MQRRLISRPATVATKPALGDTLDKLQVIRTGRLLAREPRGAHLGPRTPLPPMRPHPVIIQLPNGRWVKGHIAPAAAHRSDLAALRHVVARDTARGFAAIRHNARAIDAIVATQRDLVRRVAELQKCCDAETLKMLLERLSGLELRLGKRVRSQARAIDSLSQQQRTLGRDVELQARSARIQKLNDAATSMQVAAFGTKGNLLASNNLLVAGNGLFWSFLGDLLGLLGLQQPGQTSAWGWLSPVGSLVTGQVAVGGEQHERFISGVATGFIAISDSRAVAAVSLENHVSPRLWPRFRLRSDVPVTVNPVGDLDGEIVTARVDRGVLAILLESSGEVVENLLSARIAWLIDTGDPNG